MIKICSPALIYIIFSVTQIIIDTFKGLYNTAFLKMVVSILITILLDALCKSGMTVISWIIVFIPFIFMTVITSILLYVFGLDVSSGKLNISCNKVTETDTVTTENTSHNSDKSNIQSNIYSMFTSSDPQYESFSLHP